MDKYGWADGKPAGRGTRGGRCGPPARGPARSQRAGTTGGAAQAPGMCFSAATCSPGGVQDRRGLASFECSCCYPGNGPPGLQGLITFLKVFRSCEFWNDYINVALWGQGPAWVIPRFQSRASEKNPANKGENAACGLESLRGCRIAAAKPLGNLSAFFWVSDRNSWTCLRGVGAADTFGYWRMPLAMLRASLSSKRVISGSLRLCGWAGKQKNRVSNELTTRNVSLPGRPSLLPSRVPSALEDQG